jgi:guanylate kinase
MKNNEHVLLCVMGRTASGKDSLVNKLCERTGLTQIISYTTRERRTDEGDTHIFVTTEDYEIMKANGEVAAYTEIAENLYWTTVNQLYENDVYIIDPIGVEVLKKLNLPNLRLVTVYINTPDELREDRAFHLRKDDKEKFRIRNLSERSQFRNMLKDANFDYAVSNIEFPKAFSVLKWIASVEKVWANKYKENNITKEMEEWKTQ